MSKRLLPYSASAWVGREMWAILKKVQSTHQNDADRARHIGDGLEQAFLFGVGQSDSLAFRWGLVIGAISGSCTLGILQWLAGRFL